MIPESYGRIIYNILKGRIMKWKKIPKKII